jgi:protein-S-isoprenylcysteine O-methyltransferase Ste14
MNNGQIGNSETNQSDQLWKLGLRFFFTTVFMLAVLFISAGTFQWWEAWVYVAMTLSVLILSRIVLIQKNPELAIERAKAGGKEDVKNWDRVLMPVTAIYGPLVSWIVAGLDVRFGWSPDLPDWIQIIALVVIITGSALGSWAMIVNRFFSSHVRIQSERGHSVIREGPYQIVRHPGYAAGLLSWIAGPFYFSSYWVGIPTVLVIIASIIRTAREDLFLLEKLLGYAEYAQDVKFRLLPGIW